MKPKIMKIKVSRINEIMAVTSSKVLGTIMKAAEPEQFGRGPTGIMTPEDQKDRLFVFWNHEGLEQAFFLSFTMEGGNIKAEDFYNSDLSEQTKDELKEKMVPVLDYMAMKEQTEML